MSDRARTVAVRVATGTTIFGAWGMRATHGTVVGVKPRDVAFALAAGAGEVWELPLASDWDVQLYEEIAIVVDDNCAPYAAQVQKY